MKKLLKTALLVLIVLSMSLAVFAENTDYVVEKDERIPIPKTYEVTDVICNLGAGGFFNQAEDVFIADDDCIYVADTGNGRIVKLDPKGNFIREYFGDSSRAFASPAGVYVDKDGDIYVADTGNSRVAHMDSEGNLVENFIKPESELLGDNFTFTPNKVYVSNTGMLYVLKGQSFLSIDALNKFQGYVGQSEVGFNLRRWLIRMFATDEQKRKSAASKQTPESYLNFVIDSDGMIYATTMGSKNQIRKINSVGNNIYAKGIFGEKIPDAATGLSGDPSFVDIAIDRYEIITVLEQKSGKLYQYDQEGDLLCVFGGKGNWKGVFELPVSIAVNSEGKIFVLDRTLNNIQVFSPTNFADVIKQAVYHYSNGDYATTLDLWQEVLATDANYSLAHQGMGKVYIKEMRWADAMREYKSVEDKSGYSSAYAEFFNDLVRAHFGFTVLIIVVLIALIGVLYSILKKKASKLMKEEIER